MTGQGRPQNTANSNETFAPSIGRRFAGRWRAGSRRIKALIYHNAAAIPLVMMAELARWQGQDWYSHQSHRLGRPVTRLVEGFQNPAFFVAKSGYRQVEIPPKHIGWLLYWEKQSRNPTAVAAVLKSVGGDCVDPQYAGDVALLFRRRFFAPRSSFAPQAELLWGTVPAKAKEQVLRSGFCMKCKGSVEIVDHTGTEKKVPVLSRLRLGRSQLPGREDREDLADGGTGSTSAGKGLNPWCRRI